jgi:hypothetical protein
MKHRRKLIVHHVEPDFGKYYIVLKSLVALEPGEISGCFTLERQGELRQTYLTSFASSLNEAWVTLASAEDPRLVPGDEVLICRSS